MRRVVLAGKIALLAPVCMAYCVIVTGIAAGWAGFSSSTYYTHLVCQDSPSPDTYDQYQKHAQKN